MSVLSPYFAVLLQLGLNYDLQFHTLLGPSGGLGEGEYLEGLTLYISK